LLITIKAAHLIKVDSVSTLPLPGGLGRVRKKAKTIKGILAADDSALVSKIMNIFSLFLSLTAFTAFYRSQ